MQHMTQCLLPTVQAVSSCTQQKTFCCFSQHLIIYNKAMTDVKPLELPETNLQLALLIQLWPCRAVVEAGISVRTAAV